ncbi:MAG: hypothetical protein HPM95_08410 [Alphaproteobacteria bacterium]|nr:hypothetical protein [Alphaproteobacteria bacterium]
MSRRGRRADRLPPKRATALRWSKEPQRPRLRGFDSGNDKYSRLRVQLVPDEDTPGCSANGLHSLAYQIPSAKGLTVDGATALYATGYMIPATARKPMRPKTSVVLLSIRDFSQAELPRSLPQQHLPANADLYGTLDFSGEAATFSVIEGGGHTVGEAGGGLSLSVDGTGKCGLRRRHRKEPAPCGAPAA